MVLRPHFRRRNGKREACGRSPNRIAPNADRELFGADGLSRALGIERLGIERLGIERLGIERAADPPPSQQQQQRLFPKTDVALRRTWSQLSEGAYVLRTNFGDWSDEDLWRAYTQLADAEAASAHSEQRSVVAARVAPER